MRSASLVPSDRSRQIERLPVRIDAPSAVNLANPYKRFGMPPMRTLSREVQPFPDGRNAFSKTHAMRIALLALFCLGVPVGAGAQTIHKCTTPTETVYQSFACVGGQMETLLELDAPPVRSDPRAAQDRDISHGRELTPLDRRPALRVGMSDDEILNLPHWGRPTRITRSKGDRAWHEQWVYESFAAATRRLYFVNGKLAAVDTEPG